MSEKECQTCCKIVKGVKINKIIICEKGGCGYKCCTRCFKQNLFHSGNTSLLKCHSCSEEFSKEFITKEFTKFFIKNSYKEHIEKFLFEREQILFFAEMPYVEKIYMVKNIIGERVEKLNKYIEENCSDKTISSISEEMVNEEILKINIRSKKSETYDLIFLQNNIINRIYSGKKEEKIKKIYTLKCPGEECNGILDEKYECSLCKTKICERCHEVLKEEDGDEKHFCKKEEIKSVKEKCKNTKQCPQCFALIFQISGCDQMFCTMCKIAFSWETGKIVKGKIHNPHYYDMLREMKIDMNNVNDRCEVGCNNLPNLDLIDNKTLGLQRYLMIFENYHRLSLDISEDKILNINRENEFLCNNRNERIRYLTKEISLADFKKIIYDKYFKYEFNCGFMLIYTSLNNGIIDILNRLSKDADILDADLLKSFYKIKINEPYFGNNGIYISKITILPTRETTLAVETIVENINISTKKMDYYHSELLNLCECYNKFIKDLYITYDKTRTRVHVLCTNTFTLQGNWTTYKFPKEIKIKNEK
jgi:hypothetical protein